MNNQADQARIQLLVIEDNPADVQLLRFALDIARLDCELTVIEDGAEALALFKRSGEGARARRPDLPYSI
jgi:CheY-like chemotaxis protein